MAAVNKKSASGNTETCQQPDPLRPLTQWIDETDAAIVVAGADGRIVYLNGATTRMLGYEPHELKGRRTSDLLSGHHTHVEVRRLIQTAVDPAAALSGFRQDLFLYTKAGKPLWISAVVNAVRSETGDLVNLIGILTDITLTKMHEHFQQKVLKAMVRELPAEDVARVLCREIEQIAPTVMCAILEVKPEGRLATLAAPSLPEAVARQLDGLRVGPVAGSSGTAAWRGEAVLVADIENDPLWADHKAMFAPLGVKACWSYPVKTKDGTVIGAFAFYSQKRGRPDRFLERLVDVAVNLCALLLERKWTRAHLHQLAHYDALTGLPNRAMLNAMMEQALHEARRNGGELAVVSIDLDRFKQVNDTQGRAAGDETLREIARRFETSIRDGDLIGRFSGDEFIAILPQCGTSQAAAVVQRMHAAIARPVALKGSSLRIAASMGIAMYPADGNDMESLLRHADMAMHQSKLDGRCGVNFFSAEMNSAVQEQAVLEAELRNALNGDRLDLHYQPKIGTASGQPLYGVEALLRWQHPTLGHVPPLRFIGLAEERGLIIELDRWVLNRACRQMFEWRRRGTNVPHVAVNLSASHFRDPTMPALVAATLRAYSLKPDDLTLELTEGVMLSATPTVLSTIDALHGLGVRLSLDDFGTGYSSLGYLHRLPIDELKLDKSFVQDLEDSKVARALTASVLRIGENLQMSVVAEGVETEGQRQFLIEHGCPVLQGYLLSRPLTPDALEAWMAAAGRSA
ncbi:sensor domain-containing protein [Paraburkholderia phenazinium]|uniref:sensor domain-containing protein n=1 Tax=Paraburkholderia phenazinium TaxID=60549 RepID=UPI001FC7C607|nr:EAL domain-containing protein [Paraburkholderia phenazinium]